MARRESLSVQQIPDAGICAAILCDRGERYLDTIYSDTWVESHFGEFLFQAVYITDKTVLGKLLSGRYQVLQVLGAGGFGQTYIAQDMHRPGYPKCAIKHLKPLTYNSEFLKTARRLFTSEAETLERLGNHDQIPRLLAYFKENEEFFLAQEFIEGHTLEAELLPGHCWTENKVIQLLQQVLGILEFIHSHKVIHRDVKPNNIIRRKQDGKLVLIDFGAVKQIRTQLLAAPGQTEASIVIGTPGYMSTEQGRGNPRSNSDIYSLGIIGIRALTGLYPGQFEVDPNTGEILWQHQAHVSPGLAAVLSTMVLSFFQERYQSATEVLEAVQQLNTKTEYQSTSQAIPSQPPLPSTLLSQTSLSEQTTISVLLASRHPASSILDPEQYNSLEQILVEIVGPIAPSLLRIVTTSALSYKKIIDDLEGYLTFNQKTEFKKKIRLLLEDFNRHLENKVDKLPCQNTQEISETFVRRCEQDLAKLIGPIASFIVKKTVKAYPKISRSELVNILATEIKSNSEKAFIFQTRLLS